MGRAGLRRGVGAQSGLRESAVGKERVGVFHQPRALSSFRRERISA